MQSSFNNETVYERTFIQTEIEYINLTFRFNLSKNRLESTSNADLILRTESASAARSVSRKVELKIEKQLHQKSFRTLSAKDQLDILESKDDLSSEECQEVNISIQSAVNSANDELRRAEGGNSIVYSELSINIGEVHLLNK